MPRLFLRSKNSGSRINALDYKLVKQTQRHSVPRPAQIKYLFHFLSAKEKLFFNISFGVALLGAIGLVGVFLASHLAILPASGGEYSEAIIGQPKYINPIYATASDVDQDLTSLTYAGLFRHSGPTLEPDLAEDFSINTDTKTYNIKIRRDARFADGKPVTASDVIYTFDLIQNPEAGSPLLPAFQGVKIERVNDFEVRFTLKAPFAPFLDTLTVGILPEHIWGQMSPTSIRLAANNLQPVGAGPWQFNKMMKDASGRIDSITFTQNEYYKDRPYFKTLRFKFFDEYGSALEAIRSQNVDALSFIPASTNIHLNNKSIGLYNLQLPEYTALFFNQVNQPLLKDQTVREALLRATDKQSIVDGALQGLGSVINSPLLPGSLGYSGEAKQSTTSIDDANAELDKKWNRIEPEEYFKLRYAAVLKELGITSTTTSTVNEQQINDSIRAEMDPEQPFFRKDKDNNILQLTITTGDSEEYTRVATLLAKMWEKIGVKTSIQKVGTNQLIRESVKNRSYDVLLYSEVTGSDPDPFPFWHSSQTEFPGLNLAGFTDRNADKLLEEGRATVDLATRAQKYSQFADILSSEIPAIFLYSPTHIMAINKEIRGVVIPPLNAPSDRYSGLSTWYLKTKLKWN
jgi:peptide/nickel transport system substrate-binding protein